MARERRERPKISAARLGVLLRQRYPAAEYALMYEVRDATGFHGSRSCDALAVGLWPSRGLEIIGFEFKVSRSDWTRELANPAKAEAIAAYCDRWWLVVSDEEIVKAGELPPLWGLMTVNGDRLIAKKEAEKLAPRALDRLFVASIARAAQKSSPSEAMIAEAVYKAVSDTRKEADSVNAFERKRAEERYSELRRIVDEFEKASGVTIDRWGGGGRIGEAVRLVLERKLRLAPNVEQAANQLETVVASLRAIAKLPALVSPIESAGSGVAEEVGLEPTRL